MYLFTAAGHIISQLVTHSPPNSRLPTSDSVDKALDTQLRVAHEGIQAEISHT